MRRKILRHVKAWSLPIILLVWCGFLAAILLFWQLPRNDEQRQKITQAERVLKLSENERRALAGDIERLPQLQSQANLLESTGLFARPDRWNLAGRIEQARQKSNVDAVEFQIGSETAAEPGTTGLLLRRTPISLKIMSSDADGASRFLGALWSEGPRPIAITKIDQTSLASAAGAPGRMITEIGYDWFSLVEAGK